MIIVSQDKTRILNFDNTITLFIGFADENKKRSIRYEAVDKTYEELGIYATEERAKEVLQEIIIAINGKSQIEMTVEGITTTVSGAFYEMPLE